MLLMELRFVNFDVDAWEGGALLRRALYSSGLSCAL